MVTARKILSFRRIIVDSFLAREKISEKFPGNFDAAV